MAQFTKLTHLQMGPDPPTMQAAHAFPTNRPGRWRYQTVGLQCLRVTEINHFRTSSIDVGSTSGLWTGTESLLWGFLCRFLVVVLLVTQRGEKGEAALKVCQETVEDLQGAERRVETRRWRMLALPQAARQSTWFLAEC